MLVLLAREPDHSGHLTPPVPHPLPFRSSHADQLSAVEPQRSERSRARLGASDVTLKPSRFGIDS